MSSTDWKNNNLNQNSRRLSFWKLHGKFFWNIEIKSHISLFLQINMIDFKSMPPTFTLSLVSSAFFPVLEGPQFILKPWICREFPKKKNSSRCCSITLLGSQRTNGCCLAFWARKDLLHLLHWIPQDEVVALVL